LYDVLVLTLLIFMIVALVIGKPERHWVGLILFIILLLSGALSIDESIKYISWDVLGLIICMSIYTSFLENSGGAHWIAEYLLKKINEPKLLSFLLILLSGIISIALDNVTVVLIFAPIAFKLIEKTRIDPIALLIGVTLAANMSGSATMIGDPPAMLVASHYDLTFMDFIFYNGKPSMFFITLIPMIISTYVYTELTIKKNNELIIPRKSSEKEALTYMDKAFVYEALLFLSIQIILLSIRNIIHISLTQAALINISGLSLTRILLHRDYDSVKESIVKGFEWKTILFLIGVFTLSGAFAKHGLALRLAEAILSTGRDIYVVSTILIWLSVGISAVLDNIPYVATMLPVIDELAIRLNTDPLSIAWALLLGATLGGGITYIGATANVVGVRLLEKKGYRVTFYEFIKKSLPFNLVNVLSGWFIYWLFWLL